MIQFLYLFADIIYVIMSIHKEGDISGDLETGL